MTTYAVPIIITAFGHEGTAYGCAFDKGRLITLFNHDNKGKLIAYLQCKKCRKQYELQGRHKLMGDK